MFVFQVQFDSKYTSNTFLGLKICTAAGLTCLSSKNWYSTPCKCPKLCDSVTYEKVSLSIVSKLSLNHTQNLNSRQTYEPFISL